MLMALFHEFVMLVDSQCLHCRYVTSHCIILSSYMKRTRPFKKEQGHKLFCKIDPLRVKTNGQATDGRLGLLRPLIIINLGLVQARWGRELPEKHQIQGLTTIWGADHLVANK